MKTKHIIFLGIFLIITILYFYLFTGAKEFESYCVDNYDGHSNVLQLPIVKYKKGFLNYTFYTCTTIENEACEIRFTIDYINKTVIFDDYKKLNERIKMLQKDYARPVAQQYTYLDINDEAILTILLNMA